MNMHDNEKSASRARSPRGPFKSLVVLGESTVEGGGWLSGPQERWADLLWKLLECAQERKISYYNAGLGASVISPRSPGYDASRKPSASERLDEEVISRRPDFVVIAYGLNDMRAGMSAADFGREMEEIIDRIQRSAERLIVIANVYHMPTYRYYPPFDKGSLAATIEYNTMLEKLAERRGCLYADVWGAQGERDWVVHQDTVHANKVGNMLIAHEVFACTVRAASEIAHEVEKRNRQTEWTRNCLARQTEGIEESHDSYAN